MSYIPSRTPTITAVTLTTANTEYSHKMTAGCRHFQVKVRGGTNTARVAFAAGLVAGSTDPYMTIEAGQVWRSPENHLCDGETLYFASTNAGAVVEILEWTNGPAS